MTDIDQRIITATASYEAVVQQIDDILNGDVNAVVSVDSGTIPSIRKSVNDALTALATSSATNMGTTITEINNKIDAIETYLGDETNPDQDTARRLFIDLATSINNLKGSGYQSSTTLSSLQDDTDKIKGGQAGQTAVDPDNVNLRTLRAELGDPSNNPAGAGQADIYARIQQAAGSGSGGGGGTPGTAGLPGRVVAVFFRESATAPADVAVSENTSGTYVTINTPAGWSTTAPVNPTENVYMLVHSGQPNVAQDDMSDKRSSGVIRLTGNDGNDGADGLGGRVWRIYFRKSSTTPTLPDVTPEISSVTNAVDIQRPNGWARTIPSGNDPLYMLIQSTQPNADNTAGSDNISTMTPIPQTGAVEDSDARTDILKIKGGQAGQTAVNPDQTNLRTLRDDVGTNSEAGDSTGSAKAQAKDNREEINKIKGGQAGQTAVDPDTTNLRTLKSDADGNEEQINKIKGGQQGHTAVNVDNINLRVLDQRLGNSATPTSQAATKVWGKAKSNESEINKIKGGQAGETAVDADQTNLRTLKAEKANLSDLNDIKGSGYQSSTTLKSLQDGVDDIETDLGAETNPANNTIRKDIIDNSGEINKIKGGQTGQTAVNPDTTNLRTLRAELGDPANNPSGASAADIYARIEDAAGSGGTGGGTDQTARTSILNIRGGQAGETPVDLSNVNLRTLRADVAANIAAIAEINADLVENISRVVNDISDEDATSDAWDVGNIVLDLASGKVKYVKGTPTPIDYTMRMTSTATTSPNESLLDGHWVFGFTREGVSFPNITNQITGSTLGELNPAITGDLGDDIDAILNVTNHSLSAGYMMVIMKVDADYEPERLRLKQGNNVRVDHSLELAQTTATHKIYTTAISDDLQWGDVFGLSSSGPFTADIGLSDENGDNYLQGNIVKSFADFPLSKYTRTYFGDINDLEPVKKPGDLFIADNGDILISKNVLLPDNAIHIYPLTKDGRRFGWGHETEGARGSFSDSYERSPNRADVDFERETNKVQYDNVLDEIIVGSKAKNDFVAEYGVFRIQRGHSTKGVISGQRKFPAFSCPSVAKPEADTDGLYTRYVGCKSPINDDGTGFKHITITPGYSGTAQTLFGESMQPIIGMKKTASGYSFGDSSDDDVWNVGDQIYIDRAIPDRALRFKTRAESHTEIKNMVYGERLNFEEEGQRPVNDGDPDTRRLHFRIPAANASGELATPKGSRTNPNFNTGIFEVDLKFGEAGSFVHLPLPATTITGTQKLALFLKPIIPGAAADFDRMNLATDRYYVLNYHSNIHDYSTSSIPVANRYARYKWDLPADAAAQLSAHFSADINGAMFVGIAIIEEEGTGNQRALDKIVRSWIPIPYKQIYVNGVHIDLQIENFTQVKVGTTRSRMEVQYKTNSYTNQQREKYYPDTYLETWKDVLQKGIQIAVNVLNREGMYHIPFDITHIKPFVKDEPFVVSETSRSQFVSGGTIRESLSTLGTFAASDVIDRGNRYFVWDRVVRSSIHDIQENDDSENHDISTSFFETLEGEPDYIKQERLVLDSEEDDYPKKYLAIPFRKGTLYTRGTGSNANDMNDSHLHGTKESFAVDSDHIDGSVIIEDLYLNADNSGTNEVYFRVGNDIDESTANLPATIIHHPRSGSKLTIPATSANSVRATEVFRNDKRMYKVSSDADWSAGFPGLKAGDKISVQLMGGQAHNNPELVWYKIIN